MSNEKERKLDGVWDARRVLYNILFYADEEGYIKYVAGDAESTYGIKRQRFNAALKAYGKIEKDDFLFGCETGLRIGDYRGVWISKTRSLEKMKELFELLRQNMRNDFILHEFMHTYYGSKHCPNDDPTCFMKDAKGKGDFKVQDKLCNSCKH